MDEIGRLWSLLGSGSAYLGGLVLIYLILRLPAGLVITQKLFGNGNGSNGKATVVSLLDYKQIVREELASYDRTLQERNQNLRDDFKQLIGAVEKGAAAEQHGINRIVDSIDALAAEMRRR